MILDKSRKYGELFGTPFVKGAKYSQDGKFFTAKGELIGATPELPPAASTVPTGMPGTEAINVTESNFGRGPLPGVARPAHSIVGSDEAKSAKKPVKAAKAKPAKPTKGELIEGKPMPGISLEDQLMASASE